MVVSCLPHAQVFCADHFPWHWSVGGYICLAVMGSIVIPLLYTKVKW